VPIWFLAFAVGLDVLAIPQILVHQAPLGGRQSIQRHRAGVLQCLLRGAIRLAFQGFRATRAISSRIYDKSLALILLAEGYPQGKVLERIDGLAVASDNQSEVVAVNGSTQDLCVLLHPDVGVEIACGDDLFE